METQFCQVLRIANVAELDDNDKGCLPDMEVTVTSSCHHVAAPQSTIGPPDNGLETEGAEEVKREDVSYKPESQECLTIALGPALTYLNNETCL